VLWPNACFKPMHRTIERQAVGLEPIAGKRVLVTGADGFIGSHLTELLVAEGAQVRALSQYNSFNNWGWLEDIGCLSQLEVVPGDIRDPHFCLDLTQGIDVIFHLAALIAIPFSYKSPGSYIDTNIQGTTNICQAALSRGVRMMIHTSTSEVYGTAEYVPMDEKHPLKPQSPYSATKIGADAIALSFHYAFHLPLRVARPFNTFGPRQSSRAVVPTIISQIAAGRPEVSLGDTTTTRDFTFVEDTCRGLLAIASMHDNHGEVFNVGTGSEISVAALFDTINELMGGTARIVQDASRLRPADSEVQRLCCDNRKMRAATGFQPQVSLRDGLRRTIEWFTDPGRLRHYKTKIYNV
jgi:NAD dependent epimerase/dehydratase